MLKNGTITLDMYKQIAINDLKYSHRVAHGAYAEYLEKLQDRAGM